MLLSLRLNKLLFNLGYGCPQINDEDILWNTRIGFQEAVRESQRMGLVIMNISVCLGLPFWIWLNSAMRVVWRRSASFQRNLLGKGLFLPAFTELQIFLLMYWDSTFTWSSIIFGRSRNDFSLVESSTNSLIYFWCFFIFKDPNYFLFLAVGFQIFVVLNVCIDCCCCIPLSLTDNCSNPIRVTQAANIVIIWC